jgi:hypothetical protein
MMRPLYLADHSDRRCGLEGKKSKAATLEIDRGEQESPISKNMLFDRVRPGPN